MKKSVKNLLYNNMIIIFLHAKRFDVEQYNFQQATSKKLDHVWTNIGQ